MPLFVVPRKREKQRSRALLAGALALALVGGATAFSSGAPHAQATLLPLEQLGSELPAQTLQGQSVIFPNTLSVGVSALSYQAGFMAGATFSTQWFRDGAPIDAATGASYTPVAADGGRTLTVQWTSHVTGYRDLPVMSTGKTVALQAMTDPHVAFAAARSVGETVSVTATATSPANPLVTVQWFRGPSFDRIGGVEIPGVSGTSYTLGSEDEGKYIWPVVTLSSEGFQPVVREAPPGSNPIAPGRIAPGTVTASGDPRYGGAGLTVLGSGGTVGATYEVVEWLRNTVPIAGSAGLATYHPQLSDIGYPLAASVRVSAPGYGSIIVNSSHLWAARGTIALGTAELVVNAQAPGNRVEVGDVLTVAPESWVLPGLAYSVRWLDQDNQVHGTDNSLTVSAHHIGRQLRAEVIASATGYEHETVFSQATPTILGKRVVTLQQPIDGFQAGESLTLTVSSLTPGETVTATLSPALQQRLFQARGAAESSTSAQVSAVARDNGTAELSLTIPSGLVGAALLSVSPGDYSQLITVQAAPQEEEPEAPVEQPEVPSVFPEQPRTAGSGDSPGVPATLSQPQGSEREGALAQTGSAPAASVGTLALVLLLLGATASGVRRRALTH